MRYDAGKFLLAATDLSNHLGCGHLTQLNRKVAKGEIKKPDWSDPALVVLAKRGDEHEAAYAKYLESKNLTVADLRNKPPGFTVEAMRKGVDVITQATLSDDHWTGNADFLIKVQRKSNLGDWSYEVQDTKLSQQTRAATILQLCLYSDLLSQIQGTTPEKMYAVKPGGEFVTEEFLFADFQAYYRLVKNNLQTVIAGPPLETYPQPVAQCDICRWWKQCDGQRHADDHLSLVAGMRSLHMGELTRQEIRTLEQFARQPEPLRQKPERGNIESYHSIHDQAKVQLEGRIKNKLVYNLLPAEDLRGFSRLPEPDAGDIYFDIEGDPFFDRGGLEYLLGYAFNRDGTGLEYRSLWAFDRKAEKKAFEGFIDFVMDRWAKYPKMYIYHYGIYEPAAIKRLTGRHGTRAEEVDRLLRAERFINLHSVIREGMRASVERYSLKDLELFTDYQRTVDLAVAGKSRRALETALELNEINALGKDTAKLVEDYNRDDCLATAALHGWLEKRRDEIIQSGAILARPELKTGEASEKIEDTQTRAKALYAELVKGLPEDRAGWTIEDHAKWLLANQIEYFRREDKSAWWEYHRVHDLDFEDLLDERKAITGLKFIGEVEIKSKRKNSLPVHRYAYPEQEVGIEAGDELHVVKGEVKNFGTVCAIALEARTIDIKKTNNTKDMHARSLHVKDVITPEPLPTALFDVAYQVLEYGIDFHAPYRAAKDLLLKRRPNLGTHSAGPLLGATEDVVEGAIRIALNLKNSVLAIQGPPGSGKTYTGAMMILELTRQGKRVGVTAVSHKVIRNLFDRTLQLAAEKNINVRLVHKAGEKSDVLPDGLEEVDTNADALKAIEQGKAVGGTAWLWANNDAREKLDYLFVDEAGQMSLSFVLAASRAAKNLILLGDPQQLEQPQRGAHPEGADVAALTYLLDGNKTMPDDKGLFLKITRRLHPKITDFTSEVFYEGRLASLPGLEKQRIDGNTPFAGSGLFFVPVAHAGNQNKSKEEIDVIGKIIDALTGNGVSWINASGEKDSLRRSDLLIVAPYNAQVAALKERFPDVSIGTVDKFQGQEAAVVLYSMTSSTAEDAPRGMNFLFNPNRFNVATSRARCACILVASPTLLEPECKTIDQMKWANAVCRFREMAKEVKL